MGSTLNKTCMIINDINQRLKDGEDIEELIPYDTRGMSDDLIFELICIYKKYGKNEQRLRSMNKWLEAKR